MHHAPAVSFPTGRSRRVDAAAFTLWVAGLAASLTAAGNADTWRVASLLLASLVAGAVALSQRVHGSVVGLHFDGRQWSAANVGAAGRGWVHVALDLQVLLLLRLDVPGRGARWVWAERRADPARWLDLRRAVYSRPPTAADSGEPVSEPTSGSRPSAPR